MENNLHCNYEVANEADGWDPKKIMPGNTKVSCSVVKKTIHGKPHQIAGQATTQGVLIVLSQGFNRVKMPGFTIKETWRTSK